MEAKKMEVQIVPCYYGAKFFEVDEKSIQHKIREIEMRGIISHIENVEYIVLKCFKDMNYCMKRCMEFEAKDVFAQKSCKDCLDKYMQDFRIVKIRE
jgi:hypothetical protein